MFTPIKILLRTILGLVLVLTATSNLAADKPIPVNRLLKPHTDKNRTLKEDGIHDPSNQALSKLKDPTRQLQSLVPAKNGNFVDWSASVRKGLVTPQYDYKDESQQPMAMELEITIPVKGSTPDVIFKHSAHLQWLECNNCHPAIFQAKKGANKTSMANILRGQSCGVCHGSVAFPINSCNRCHSASQSSSKK
ncbi:MAG: cytochrome c3 family protein [Gammaproteobacteria bacterium]|jgi:c(7)-type cytochrome triheme protein